ncbi:MinD-like ATPase involved in chromosome partitioning or flagellar assembly [Anaerobacterium chartisolvens]|uniref:MinD-like ATPase involved in chromosome partitioning or flagellar assembly n=1 Tax=Anaerobacterium chartisolvens TaxID=1297424 RepID=A0A369B9Q0_9FIRM|nr:ATPase [Anaerobacterium chartisolvens]RCX18253.1 MinD-like ATPase involved in chromosome partitioning or flagellar assembly [Anaerobacterium chartisolvens]
MGRQRGKLSFDDVLQRLSPRDRVYGELEASRIIDNVIGFIPASDCCDTSILVSNLAALLAARQYSVCILDNKVFYPSIYKILDCEANPRDRGLIKLLRSDRVDFRDEINSTRYKNLFLLSPSPMDAMEDYFDFTFGDIERVMTAVKDMFDLVIVDIPNIPPLEFCVSSIKHCNTGFFVWSERIECPQNTEKFLEFVGSLGIGASKFTNIVINNISGLNFDREVISEMKMKLIAEFPFIPKAADFSIEGKVYIQDSALLDKRFERALNALADVIAG